MQLIDTQKMGKFDFLTLWSSGSSAPQIAAKICTSSTQKLMTRIKICVKYFRLAVNTFTTDAEKLAFDITADSEEQQRLNQQMKRWDRKKMKMVGVQSDKKGKIRTESGLWIPATYKGNRYEQWKERTKIDAEQDNDESDNEDKSQKPPKQTIYTHWAQHNTKVKEKQKRVELKAPEQILKQREIVERRKKKMLMKKKKGGKKGGGRSSGGRSGGGGGKRRK